MPRLILHRGREDERVFDLHDTATIGRGQDCSISIPDNNMSRKHARIDVVAGLVVITDLKSSNGSFVNGTKVERRELAMGDEVRCGSHTFVLAPGADEEPMGLVVQTRTPVHRLTMADLLPRGAAGSSGSLRLPSLEAHRRTEEKLEILLQVSEVLSSPEPIDSLLAKTLDLVFKILDVDRAAILMVGAGGQLEARAVKSAIPIEKGATIWSRHIVSHVMQSGAAAIFRDAARDTRIADLRSIVQQSIRASMCAPLRPKTEVVGVLYVDNLNRPNLFSEEDLEFLGAFANQAAIAIENASLYKRIEDEAVLRNSLLRFFPPATIQKMLAAKEASLGVIETEVTALFADISEFTRFSGDMEPRRVVELLNEYFPVMAGIVFQHEGTLEKYIGDALLAVWGAPFGHPDDADRAVRAAIAMQRAAASLGREVEQRHGVRLRIHVGLNTGQVAAGNIGSHQYIQYATIGDATNVASRVCSAAPEGEIWIADATFAKITDPSIIAQELAPLRVKGKDAPLRVYRVPWELDGSGRGGTLDDATAD